MIPLLVALAWADDPRADAMQDGTLRAEVAVRFAAPTLPGWYDADGYAAAFPAQWQASGAGVCWLPVYETMGATKVDYTVSYLIGSDGRVGELSVVEAVPDEVRVCLQLRSRDWVLPLPTKRPVRVKQLVSFSRWERGAGP